MNNSKHAPSQKEKGESESKNLNGILIYAYNISLTFGNLFTSGMEEETTHQVGNVIEHVGVSDGNPW